VPIILALGLGFSSVLAGRSRFVGRFRADRACLDRSGYRCNGYGHGAEVNEIIIWDGIGHTLLTIIKALLPLLVLFTIFQFLVLKLPLSYVFNLLKGALLALIGLTLLLREYMSVFFPAGQEIGEILGVIKLKWLLIPFGFLMGVWRPGASPPYVFWPTRLKKLQQVLYADLRYSMLYHLVLACL